MIVEKLSKETKDIEKLRVQITETQRKLADFVLKEEYAKTVNDLRNLKDFGGGRGEVTSSRGLCVSYPDKYMST